MFIRIGVTDQSHQIERGIMSEGRVLTCVYCGHEYPQDTPASGSEILTDHIKVCEKHPMRKMAADNALLRKALVGLVGAESREELEQIGLAIRAMPAPMTDKVASLNAIDALIQTAG